MISFGPVPLAGAAPELTSRPTNRLSLEDVDARDERDA